MDKVTSDTILGWLKTQVEEKRPIPPEMYLDAAIKLNVLRSDENDRLIELEHQLATVRHASIASGMTSAAAKVKMEADPLFKEVQQLRAKLKQIEEAIRLGKKYATIKDNELSGARFGQV